ncbi:MAG: metallophosphoesterase [Planctomycetota bacterium]
MTTIVHVSDLHLDRIVPGSDEALLRAIRGIEPDAVVASGDFTMAGRMHEFAAARDFLRRIDAPVIACPGNHDIPAYAMFQRFLFPLGRYNRFIAAGSTDAARIGGVAVLALNTARSWNVSFDWSRGTVSGHQIATAQSFFRENADASTKLLVAHHPFCVPRDAPTYRVVGNAARLLAAVEPLGVDAVLAGHLHRQFESTAVGREKGNAYNARVLQAGTALSVRRRGERNGFLVLRCANGIEEVSAFAFDRNEFVPVTLRKIAEDALLRDP